MANEQQVRNAAGQMLGAPVAGALNQQQSYIQSPELLQWAKEGRVYTVEAGAIASAATFNSTSVTTLRPDVAIRVPASIVIVPVQVSVIVKAVGGALTEVLVRSCRVDVGAGTSTAYTPVNSNTDVTKASGCTAAITYTADCAAITNPLEVDRGGAISQLTLVSGPMEQYRYAPFQGRGAPCVVGGRSAASFLVNVSTGTSSSGFVIVTYAEFTAAEWYGA